jgi:hypothetical protein
MLLLSVGSSATAAQADPVRFENGYLTEQQGDIVETTVILNRTDRATVQFNAAEGGYGTTLEVSDESGDGMVTLQFDTLRADDPAEAFQTATESDRLSVVDHSVKPSTPSTLPTGRYNIIVSSGDTRIAGIIWIESPLVHGSTTCALPSDVQLTEADCNGSSSQVGPNSPETSASATPIAAGDTAAVQYRLSGIESRLQSSQLENQLLFASDTANGAQTTHIMQFSNETTIEGQSVRIRYHSGDVDLGSSSNLVENLGVDTNGNGVIDRSLQHAISGYSVSPGGELLIMFDRPVALAGNETLLFEYGVVNPESRASDRVEVTFGNEKATGEISYGPAGRGTLGSGIDLRIEGSGTDIVSPMRALDVAHDSRTDTLTVGIDTDLFERGTYDIVLTVDGNGRYPHAEPIVLRERIQIVEPVIDEFSVTENDGQISVSAHTNLAPNTPLLVQLKSTPDDFRYLFVRQAVVQENGTVSYLFESPIRGQLFVTLHHDRATVAGPTQVMVDNRTNSSSGD